MSTCLHMPELILLSDYDSDYFKYEEAVYQLFLENYKESMPIFKGKSLALKRHPLVKNKEATFWHLTSEGPVEQERIPDLRRYERINWAKTIIEYCYSSCIKIKTWENMRKGEKRVLIWCEDVEYLVVLADRGTYTLLWSAYPVTESHRKRKLLKEYQEYIENMSN